MATTLALAMRASMSASGVVSGANQAAGALASFGSAAAKVSQDAKKISDLDFSSFGAGASSASSAVQALASRALELKAAFDSGAISEEQMKSEMLSLAGAAARLSQMQLEGLSVTQQHASASEVFAERQRQLNALLDAGAISEETHARAMARATEQLNQSNGVTAKSQAARAKGEAVTRSVMTAEEKYASEIKDLRKLLNVGAISQQTFNRAVAKADDDLKKAASQSDRTSSAMSKMGRQAQKTASDVSVLKNLAIGVVVAKGITMAADAFVAAGRAALSYASSVAKSVDAMNDLAQRTGMGVEALQALQMAGRLSGVEDVTTAVQKLAVAIGQAADSGKTDAFTKLGLNFAELQAMSPEDQFRAVQAAISALPTPAERAAAAVAVFGKAGVELLPLMNQNLAEVEDRMRRLGAIVGTDQVEAIGAMNDSLDMVQATFDGIIGNVVGNLAPVVESLANEFLAFVESWNSMNGDGGGIADTISNALLDIAEYFAGVFDAAMASFDGFGVTLTEVAAVFEFVGNVFTAVAETLRAGFNLFQIAGNVLAMGLGKFLEGIGSWVSSDLQQFGKDLAATAERQAQQNSKEMKSAASNAGAAATRAVFGGNAAQGTEGPATRAVRSARNRMTPEERVRRQAERDAKASQDRAAREASAAQAKQEQAAKKASELQDKIDAKAEDAAKIESDRAAALGGKSNESLKANDIRSSEGIAQYLALATGREDPAIAEYRKQTEKLNEIKTELRALQQQKVEILGAAA